MLAYLQNAPIQTYKEISFRMSLAEELLGESYFIITAELLICSQ